MFERYLNHTAKSVGEGRHPLSVGVLDVLDAAVSTIDAHALTLCATIEGVLSGEFGDLVKQPAEHVASVKRAIGLLKREGFDRQFMDRVVGLFSMMQTPSAKDRLRRMVDIHVITEAQMEAWNTIRNRSAHGKRFAFAEDKSTKKAAKSKSARQEAIDRLFRVIVLFHRLVFAAIGYTGPYTDYGTHGWPTRSRRAGAPPAVLR